MCLRGACRRFWLAAISCLLPVWLVGAAVAETGADWSRRVWQMDDGLPGANVTGIAQTRDGFLWLATQSGLARFDGVQFEVVPVPVGRERPIIRAMLCDAAENFWLAEVGGAVVCFGRNTARLFGVTNGLPNTVALQLVETPDHTLWLAYDDGSVFCITPRDEVRRLNPADGLYDEGICSLTLDARGRLWFAKGQHYGFWNGQRFELAGELAARNAQILAARDGGLWFCNGSQILKAASNGVPVVVTTFTGEAARLKPSVLFDAGDGGLWVGTTSDGLFRLVQTNFFKVETSQNKIHAIFGDAENSLWVGTDGGGLNRLLPKVLELRGRGEVLPFETVRSLGEDHAGRLWVVTQDGLLTQLAAGNWENGHPVENWPGGLAHSVVVDRQGTVWIATHQRNLVRWRDGKFTKLGAADGLAGTSIRSLLVDRQNDLWLGVESEPVVQRLHDGKFQTFKQPPGSRAVRAMTEDAAGQIWFGTMDGVLLRLAGDELVTVPTGVSDPPYPIRCLAATPDGSVWIGYAAYGLCRLKAGKISHLGPGDGLFDGNICALMPDDAGRMWFASDRGIFYVSLAQLNKFADDGDPRVQSVFYGRDAGLPGLQAYYGYWPGAARTRAGDILFPTHSGIAVVHPDHVRIQANPPNVLIRNVLVDGKEIARPANASARLLPGHRKLEILFTAPSFIAPEQVRFRYRLAGWSEEWSELDHGRTAVFSRLPPGNYRFQVTACNNNGVWNPTGATFAFAVAPFFWQSWPFRLLVGLGLLMLVVAVVRHFMLRRVRQLLRRVEQEAALQRERTRIAQDMHDELGARFTQISLLGELSRNALAEPARAGEFLAQISSLSQSGVKSLDEIVWAVNPRNDTLADLLDYTGQYARYFLAAAGIECRLDFPDELPDIKIPGEMRHGIFLIIKEALNNVVKHAQAARVKIIFERDAGRLRWLIEDNGQGFAAAPDNALADGLRNIRQRSEALNGSATIHSFPGKGTRVTMEIPLPK